MPAEPVQKAVVVDLLLLTGNVDLEHQHQVGLNRFRKLRIVVGPSSSIGQFSGSAGGTEAGP